MKAIIICILFGMSHSVVGIGQNDLFRMNEGDVNFTSEAPLELIKAQSSNLQGILDFGSGEFAFRMLIGSFEGFNSPLQREHFFENYMEIEKYSLASFQGKIIETIKKEDSIMQHIRAKGQMSIHGVSNEMIIPVLIKYSTDGTIEFSSEFYVRLDDHNIHVPKIVYQKIAQLIKVEVQGVLSK